MSNNIIASIVEFNKQVLNIEQRTPCIMPDNEVSITVKSLNEEAKEFQDAYEAFQNDLSIMEDDLYDSYIVQMSDALIDNIYFAIGALYKMGLTADQIERSIMAVHNCNMEKKLGTNAKRDTGAADAVKPADWIGPEQRIMNIMKERKA